MLENRHHEDKALERWQFKNRHNLRLVCRKRRVVETARDWVRAVFIRRSQIEESNRTLDDRAAGPGLWLAPACAQCWSGWTPMEVASADERRTYELFVADFSVCLWVSSQANEPRVHDQETNVSGLLQMWPGI